MKTWTQLLDELPVRAVVYKGVNGWRVHQSTVQTEGRRYRGKAHKNIWDAIDAFITWYKQNAQDSKENIR